MLCLSAEPDAPVLERTSSAGRPTERAVRLRGRSRGSVRAEDGGEGMVVVGAGFGRRAGRMVLLIPRVFLVAALGRDTTAAAGSAVGSAAGLAVAVPSSSLRGRQGPFPPRKWEKSTLLFAFVVVQTQTHQNNFPTSDIKDRLPNSATY